MLIIRKSLSQNIIEHSWEKILANGMSQKLKKDAFLDFL